MNPNPKDLPIACRLSDWALGRRKATLRDEFWPLVRFVEELPDGYAFHLALDEKAIVSLAPWIAAERECCPFLRFEIVAEPDSGPVTLRLTGPPGTRDFLKNLLLEATPPSPEEQ